MDEETAPQIRALAVESHSLEAKIRQAILEQVYAEHSEAPSAKGCGEDRSRIPPQQVTPRPLLIAAQHAYRRW